MATSSGGGGLLSYRVSLVIAIPLLVIVTGAILAGTAYATTRESISALARSLFAQVAGQTAETAKDHLEQAGPIADALADEVREDGAVPSKEKLARRLIGLLDANPGFAWVALSQPDGTYTAAERRGDGIILDTRRVTDAGTILDEEAVLAGGTRKSLRHDEHSAYDPRKRPFYQRAVATKHRVWVGPYVFYESGVPGVTCAEPVFGRDGTLLAVVSIDFDLNALSTFVATLHTSEHSRVFLYTDDARIIAHPTVRVATKEGANAEGKLVTKDDVPDEATRDYFKGRVLGPVGHAEEELDVDGGSYFAATRRFEVDGGLTWNVGAIAPAGDFLGDLTSATHFMLVISALAMGVAAFLGAFLAGRIAAPLANLAAEMEKVGQFDLTGPPPPRSMFTEIARMNRALVAMKGGLSSFASYVPRDLVLAVLASGETAVLGGRTKPMTVFFSDLAGFTTLAESMTPSDLVDLLGRYFDAMTATIARRRGTIDKFIGDAIMAFWNAPADEPDHAVLACEAALGCAKRLRELRGEGGGLAKLSARIGIATGDVLVGNIGSHERMNYTVMGDTANLASRLEGLGKVYGTEISVSEPTHAAAKGKVVMRAIDLVAVKGKARGVRLYEPIALRDGADPTALRREALSDEALNAYLARRWDVAARAWGEMAQLDPNDVASRLMKERAEGYEKAPPPAEWDGVHVMHEK